MVGMLDWVVRTVIYMLNEVKFQYLISCELCCSNNITRCIGKPSYSVFGC
jgi:hypothetical protein